MADLNNLRTQIMEDQDKLASKSRFALFSQPPPNAIGDDGQYKTKKHLRGQDGKPVTQPRQMLGGSNRSGAMKSSYINVPESIHIRDNFQQQYKRQWQSDKKLHTRSGFHELQFKPSSGHTTLLTTSYKYKQDPERERKQIEKDQTGKVKTQKPNALINPCSKIQTNFLKRPPYMKDQYERQRQFQNRQRQQHHKKMPDHNFQSMSHGNRTFYKDKTVFGEDDRAKSMLSTRRHSSSTSHINKYSHENKFKLARRGHGDPIGKYPEFVEKRTSQIVDLKLKKSASTKQKWKHNNFGLTRPTPSITFHPQNIKVGRYK